MPQFPLTVCSRMSLPEPAGASSGPASAILPVRRCPQVIASIKAFWTAGKQGLKTWLQLRGTIKLTFLLRLNILDNSWTKKCV